MMRLVLDTNVVISALLWNGSPARLLASDRPNEVDFFTSTQLLAELSETLSRRKFLKKVSPTRRTVDQLVYRYSDLAAVVVPLPTPRLAPDPDDDVVIGTALAAKADLLVTGDRDLLSVSTFEGGRIVTVQEALRYIQIA
jgi:putative PIN family toxin of toxin-antitoxin system